MTEFRWERSTAWYPIKRVLVLVCIWVVIIAAVDWIWGEEIAGPLGVIVTALSIFAIPGMLRDGRRSAFIANGLGAAGAHPIPIPLYRYLAGLPGVPPGLGPRHAVGFMAEDGLHVIECDRGMSSTWPPVDGRTRPGPPIDELKRALGVIPRGAVQEIGVWLRDDADLRSARIRSVLSDKVLNRVLKATTGMSIKSKPLEAMVIVNWAVEGVEGAVLFGLYRGDSRGFVSSASKATTFLPLPDWLAEAKAAAQVASAGYDLATTTTHEGPARRLSVELQRLLGGSTYRATGTL